MSDFIEKLKAVREAVWEKNPDQVEDLLDPSKGYTDTWDSAFFPTLYGWLETVCSRNVLYVMRKTLIEKDLDLETVKQILEELLAMYVPFVTWANLPDTASLFQEASEAVSDLSSKEQVTEFLEELVLYTGRLNYRIEPLMPWPELIQTFDATRSQVPGSL